MKISKCYPNKNSHETSFILCFTFSTHTLPVAMATSFLPIPTNISTNPPSKLPPRPPQYRRKLSVCASTTSPTPAYNVDYVNREFGGHGVSFAELGDGCVVRLAMDNGSSATLMLPSGLISSYKPHMWHGAAMEVLHTTVSEGEDGSAVIRGGVSLGFKCGDCSSGASNWSPVVWSLLDVAGGSDTSVQVKLKCNDLPENIEMKYTVTLGEHLLRSELNLINKESFPVHVTGTFVSHLTVSTPDATYAVGLQGSNYFGKPPIMSEFSIFPPGFSLRDSPKLKQSWSQMALDSLMSRRSQGGIENEKYEDKMIEGELCGEEEDDYSHMTEKTSRVYTSTPKKFTIIDRGRRNSVIVERKGFNEMYIFSPGSNYEWYGKYAYVCIGPAALLKAIILGPQQSWSGFQCLHNPNS